MGIGGTEEVNNLTESARAFESSGDFKRSAEIYFEALKMESYNQQLQSFFVEAAKRNVENCPKDPDAHMALGDAYACAGDFEGAEGEFEIVMQLSNDRENPIVLSAIGSLKKMDTVPKASRRS